MSGTFSQAYAPQFAGGVFQVASQFIGQCIVESIRKQLPHRKVQRGDLYATEARGLLRTNFDLINPSDQPKIKALLELVADDKEEIENGGGSKLRRMLQARVYKCHSKELYIVVKKASDRAIHDTLLTQIRRALGETEFNTHNPFVGPPGARTFTDSSVDSLLSVELMTYEAEDTGDMPVGLTLHNENGTTEEILAQIWPGTEDSDQTVAIIPLGEEQRPPDSAEVRIDRQGHSSDPTS